MARWCGAYRCRADRLLRCHDGTPGGDARGCGYADGARLSSRLFSGLFVGSGRALGWCRGGRHGLAAFGLNVDGDLAAHVARKPQAHRVATGLPNRFGQLDHVAVELLADARCDGRGDIGARHRTVEPARFADMRGDHERLLADAGEDRLRGGVAFGLTALLTP